MIFRVIWYFYCTEMNNDQICIFVDLCLKKDFFRTTVEANSVCFNYDVFCKCMQFDTLNCVL